MLLSRKPVASQSAFIEELYRRYWLTLFIMIRQQIASKEEAEDILLEVFLAALENPALSDLSEHHQLTWLRRVASNKCVDHYRRSARRSALSLEHTEAVEHIEATLFNSTLRSPEQMMLAQEEVELLRQHLSSLSEIQQQVLVLRFAEGLPCAQIATRLHKSEGAIRTLLSRTLNLLRKLYGKRKGSPTHE